MGRVRVLLVYGDMPPFPGREVETLLQQEKGAEEEEEEETKEGVIQK